MSQILTDITVGNLILDIIGQKVILNSDLAAIYKVKTIRLNEQVIRYKRDSLMTSCSSLQITKLHS